MGYRSYRLITVTETVLEKVTVTVAIAVTVSLRELDLEFDSSTVQLVTSLEIPSLVIT